MKFRPYALLACLVLVGTMAACSEDPTAAGSGEPEAIVTTRSLTNQTVGTHFSITAYTLDKNAQRMAGELDAAPNGGNITIDSIVYVHELLETRVFMKAATKTAAAGATVTVSGHGLTKDVTVVIS
jgi:hypothetical protein